MAAITKTERALWGAGIAVTLCLALGGCDDGGKTQKSNEELEAARETALMADAASAGPLLERRLVEKVRVVDGLLFTNPFDDLFVLPANAPWTIACGLSGFSITLGNTITGADGEVENGVKVILTEAQIDQKNCNVLAARIGKRLQSILGRDNSLTK
jgi:hypothetical protein